MGQVAVNIGKFGAVPTDPQTIRDNIDAKCRAILPGYTSDLPKSLVEDVASTQVTALAQMEQNYIEAINSISATRADLNILNQIAQQTGIAGRSEPQRTSVYVVFTGTPGYVVPKGFIISDSVYQYEVQTGGVIGTLGETEQLFCLATQDGSWSVPAGTVTTLITSVATGFTLTVTNTVDGIPSAESEAVAQFRYRVLRSMTYTVKGALTYLKEMLYQISGVQSRLVSVIQQPSGGWSVICGGGDPYQIAHAIYTGLFDISLLKGSDIDSNRDININLYDYPDTYLVKFITPPMQEVAITVTWNSSSIFLVSSAAVAAAAAPALIGYINSIPVGMPINDLTLAEVFKDSIKDIINVELITRLVFAVSINGIGATLVAGTHIYDSDPESYFFASAGSMAINQG